MGKMVRGSRHCVQISRAVENVPELATSRRSLLALSRKVAHLDAETKSQLEDAASLFSIGFSHGKEMLSPGKPDVRKMSFYANPLHDELAVDNIEELIASHRAVYGRNVWPNSTLPALRGSFRKLGAIVHSVGGLIAQQLDTFAMARRDGYTQGAFLDAIATDIPKARLLYYYSDAEMAEMEPTTLTETEPVQISADSDSTDSESCSRAWCGWHNDHSALTGLVLGQFFDESANVIADVSSYGDGDGSADEGGLFLMDRGGVEHHIALSESEASRYLAFQIGETSQILSGGLLYATPHTVKAYRGAAFRSVSRASFAVFHQPKHAMPMKAPFHEGLTLHSIQRDHLSHLNVPPLASRWQNASGDTFGQFTARTFEAYYAMKMQ